MDTLVSFEKLIYADKFPIKLSEITDVEFCANRLAFLPTFRPHTLDQVVLLCKEYCNNGEFKKELLDRASISCPVIVYRLFISGIFSFFDIERYLSNKSCLLLGYYFKKYIDDFNKITKGKFFLLEFDEMYLKNENEYEILYKYGFFPGSLEYVLKYDDINALQNTFNEDTHKPEQMKWSPFEWSRRPDYLDILSFSAFFWFIELL